VEQKNGSKKEEYRKRGKEKRTLFLGKAGKRNKGGGKVLCSRPKREGT